MSIKHLIAVAAGVMVAVCGAGSPLAPYFNNLPEGTDPADAPAATATDALGCEYLFPSAGRTSLGYWAGAIWSGAGAVKDAKAWHAFVRDFAAALRNPIKVSIR